MTLIFTCGMVALFLDKQTLLATKYYWLVKLTSILKGDDKTLSFEWNGVKYANTVAYLKNSKLLIDGNEQFIQVVSLSFAFSFLIVMVVCGLFMRFLRKKGKDKTEDKLIRGRRVATPKELESELKKKKAASDITIDGLHLFPKDFEVKHIRFSGTSGAGKSVAIRKLLKQIRARGEKAIIYDKGCTFVSRFYDPKTDVILNPFDERCAYWDVWKEGHHATDFENHAAALIPQHGEGDPFWVTSARTIFTSTAFMMKQKETAEEPCTTERLLDLLLTSELDDLTKYLKGTESASLVSDKIEKTAISIKSVLAAYIKSLRFLEGLDKVDSNGNERRSFSIHDWVVDDNEKGFLFITSNAKQHPSLRPLISMWLSIASTAILSMAENSNRRVWVIIDETPSLHKLPELPNTLAEVRKHGGCFIIGYQSPAQLIKVYGQHAANEMLDLANTGLFFRNPTNAMAEISSKDLGEQDIEQAKENYSYGADSVRDGISLGTNTITRRAVAPSEIMELEDLECWLKITGRYPVTMLTLKYDEMEHVAPSFLFREYDPSESMKIIDSMLTYYQLGAITCLSEEDRKAHYNIHKKQFEGDDETQEGEEQRMSGTMKTKNRNDDQDIEKQKAKEQRLLNEQLATPEIDINDVDNNLTPGIDL